MMSQPKFTWENLRDLTQKEQAGKPLHMNSILRIRDLRFGYGIKDPEAAAKTAATKAEIEVRRAAAIKAGDEAGVRAANESLRRLPRVPWIPASEDARDADGKKVKGGRYLWFWNPQLDTFQQLERILQAARALGFNPLAEQPLKTRAAKLAEAVARKPRHRASPGGSAKAA